MPTFEATQAGYRNMWAKCVIRPEKTANAAALADHIVSHKARYQAAEAKAGVPWFVIGCIHYREADFDFNTFLGNGQPLNRVTTEVPAGLGPWDSWEAGAAEALKKYRHPLPWSAALCLFTTEELNGWGYVARDVNSPYVWSWTNLYTSSKFIADHEFSSSAVDAQCGCAAILKELEHRGAITFQEAPMPDAIPTVIVNHPTTGQPFTLPKIDVAEIETMLRTAGTVLPIVAAFFPPLKVALPFLPIVDGLLQAVLEIQQGGDVPAIIAKHLEAIAAQVKSSFPPAPPAAAAPPPA